MLLVHTGRDDHGVAPQQVTCFDHVTVLEAQQAGDFTAAEQVLVHDGGHPVAGDSQFAGVLIIEYV